MNAKIVVTLCLMQKEDIFIVSMVMIKYKDGTDVDNAAIKLREKFDTINLPDGCSDPVIYNINVNDMK